MSWAAICRQNINSKDITKIITKDNPIKKKDYFINGQLNIQNVLPVFVMIEYFKKICQKFRISDVLAEQLSHIILPYLQPHSKCFTDYYQRVIYKNQYLKTHNGICVRDLVKNAYHYKGYDIVSTWGLSSKIFDHTFRTKYFHVNYIGNDGIDIDFFENFYNAIDDYWTFKLKLSLSNIMDLVKQSINLEEFQKKLIKLYTHTIIFVPGKEYKTIMNLKNNKLNKIYHILNKYRERTIR